MDRTFLRFATVPLLAASMAGCEAAGPTGPTLADLFTERAAWATQNLTSYSYDYESAGFFICCSQGQEITLAVRNDTVVSAVFVATGQPVPGSPSGFPTIDALFGAAERALRNGALSGITFDPRLHYPLRIDFAGPPDASGSVFAARLRSTQ